MDSNFFENSTSKCIFYFEIAAMKTLAKHAVLSVLKLAYLAHFAHVRSFQKLISGALFWLIVSWYKPMKMRKFSCLKISIHIYQTFCDNKSPWKIYLHQLIKGESINSYMTNVLDYKVWWESIAWRISLPIHKFSVMVRDKYYYCWEPKTPPIQIGLQMPKKWHLQKHNCFEKLIKSVDKNAIQPNFGYSFPIPQHYDKCFSIGEIF